MANMLEAIWDALVNTPLWVYVLFTYLLYIGFKGTHPGVVSLKKLFILPLLFLGFSINTFFTAFHFSWASLGVFLSALALGGLGGWLLVPQKKLRFDHNKGLVGLPGTWWTLILIMLIFGSKYYFGYQYSVDPTLKDDTNFELLALAVSAACTGLFLGRLACYLHCKRNAPQHELSL